MKKNKTTKRRNPVPPPLRDAASKAIFASTPFMAQILKDTVGELADLDRQEIMNLCLNADVHFARVPVHDLRNPDALLKSDSPDNGSLRNRPVAAIANEDVSPTEGNVYFDILLELSIPLPEGGHVVATINIEVQNEINIIGRIIKRGIYYCSRLISRQNNRTFKAPKYENLRKVYSIWLLASADGLLANSIRRISLKEEIVAVKKKEAKALPARCYDMMEVVVAGIDGDYVPTGQSGILELLWLLSSREMDYERKKQYLQEVFEMDMTEQMEEEIHDLHEEFRRYYGPKKFAKMEEEWKLKAAAKARRAKARGRREGIRIGKEIGEEQGIRLGEERGIKLGEERGIRLGEEKGVATVAVRMLKEGFSLGVVMSVCDLSEAEVSAIRERLVSEES